MMAARAEAAGWVASVLTAVVPLTLALLWVDAQSGAERGLDKAVLLDLSQVPPVVAVAEPPPAQPAAAPEAAPPSVEEPAPVAPTLDTLPETALAAALAEVQPELAPVQDQVPEPLAEAEVVDVAIPSIRPRPRVEKPDAQPAKPPKQADAAAKPSAQPSQAASGSTASKPVQTATRAGSANLEAGWGAAIRKKIDRRKAYPKAAGGAQGRVTLRLTVAQDGVVEAVGVSKSSGNAALDQAALTAVSRAGRMPQAPAGLDQPRHSFTLPMDFAP